MVVARLLKAAFLAAFCAAPLSAIEIVPITGRMAVGSTGIYCVTQPCPWRGIVELENSLRDPLRPLWNGDTLPVLRASAEDAARIEAAWAEGQCLEIEGAFYADIGGAPVLRVYHILGEC